MHLQLTWMTAVTVMNLLCIFIFVSFSIVFTTYGLLMWVVDYVYLQSMLKMTLTLNYLMFLYKFFFKSLLSSVMLFSLHCSILAQSLNKKPILICKSDMYTEKINDPC